MKTKRPTTTNKVQTQLAAAAGTSASALAADPAPTTPSHVIEVFNLRDNWEKVIPHLAKVAAVLTKCINVYLAESREEHRLYAPIDAPWKTSTNLRLWLHIRIMEAVERGEFTWERPRHDASQEVTAKTWEQYRTYAERFCPKPDTFDWYYTDTAQYYMAPWLIALGKEMFPEFIWAAFYAGKFSFAGGIDMQGTLRVLFDMRVAASPNANEMLQMLYKAKEHPEHGEKCAYPGLTVAMPSRPEMHHQPAPSPAKGGGKQISIKTEQATLVEFNGLLMPEIQRTNIEAAQTQQTFKRKGVTRERIRYGQEITNWKARKRPCHDCDVVKGQIHVFGCDVEECPFCGSQAFICGCKLKIPKCSGVK